MSKPLDPDRFRNPTTFCRYAVRTIADASTVRVRCREHFDRAPSIPEIQAMRDDHMRPVLKYRQWSERRGEQA